MFREMRRKKQALRAEECAAVLERGTSGVLALSGDGGYPYAVPLSYVFDGDRLYFHCARDGHKLDAVRRDGRASFCVIDQDHVVPKEYTTRFRSVVAFGTIRILDDAAEKRAAVEKLAVKYAPEDPAGHREQMIDRDWERLCMLEMRIEHMTGKESRELAGMRAEAGSGDIKELREA